MSIGTFLGAFMTPSPKIENKDLMKILLWYKIALVLKTK